MSATLSPASSASAQPFADRAGWIVADARIDARGDLRRALGDAGQHPRADASDPELILLAYRTWDEACVERLLGDFAFAIWDGARRSLFCARDHLGVKPFYYAHVQGSVVFSNTLAAVRAHPSVACALDDDAVADFLLFGVNQQNDGTTFRDVRRLPAAHIVRWSPDGARRRRYWTLPIGQSIFFKRPVDYTDRFLELLRASLDDRLGSGSVAVLMSGGIDSTTLAAVATGVARERRNGQEIHAITSVYDTLVPDDERRFAQLAADHLRIPIHFDVRDDEPSFADWRELTIATPEPVANPAAFLAWARFMKKASSIAKVFLYGEGPDDALRYEWRAYLSHLAARRQGSAFVRAIASDIVMHPRPFLWSSARQLAGRRRDATRWRRTFPPWLEPGFVAARRLHERWQEHQDRAAVSAHPARPRAHHSFTVPQWPQLFEDCDLQGAAVHAEFRHPYLDVRLLQYMLAVPVMPWCRAKLLLRRSMRGTLPPEVVRRKKTPAAANVDRVRLAASGLPRLPPAPGVAAYLDLDRVPRRPESVVELRAALRALGLNFWLSAAPSSRQVSHEIAEGDRKRSDPAEAV